MSVQMNTRILVEELPTSSTALPASACILAAIGAANPGERAFGDPDVADPWRDNALRHPAFDGGPQLFFSARC
ncbi:hypothetical protein GCM10023201_14980 [Actinomycetospora corticicola]